VPVRLVPLPHAFFYLPCTPWASSHQPWVHPLAAGSCSADALAEEPGGELRVGRLTKYNEQQLQRMRRLPDQPACFAKAAQVSTGKHSLNYTPAYSCKCRAGFFAVLKPSQHVIYCQSLMNPQKQPPESPMTPYCKQMLFSLRLTHGCQVNNWTLQS
jgi:hypothetical protein